METSQIDELLDKDYSSEGTENQKALENLHRLLYPGIIFVVIGANIGKYPFVANKILKKSSIYAIEPEPFRFSKLKENCQKWEILSSNSLYALQIAMSAHDGQTSFYITNSPVSGGFFQRDISELKEQQNSTVKWEEITVDSYKMDTLFKAIEPDLIRIDIRGSELQVLQGSTNILKQGKAKFLIELNHNNSPENQKNNVDVYNFMNSFGYSPKDFYGQVLFINPKKSLIHGVKRIYRQIIPESFRRQIKGVSEE